MFAEIKCKVVVVQSVLNGMHTMSAIGTSHIEFHIIGKRTRFAGVQTIGAFYLALVIFIKVIGEIPTTYTGCILLAVVRVLGIKNVPVVVSVKRKYCHNKILLNLVAVVTGV